MYKKNEYTRQIREEAKRLGFSFIGFAKAEFMEEEARHLERWLQQGAHGSMSFMARNFDKRVDPTKLVDGAKTVISLLYNYHTDKKQQDPEAPKIATYAYGNDYHFFIKRKLKDLLYYIRDNIGAINGRVFIDSAPVMEREWARRSGNGWIGKNTLLIHPKQGSNFFLAELIIDLELVYDSPIKDYCGSCTKCIDACPTKAISENGYWMDGSKCISYLTIELREAIPEEFSDKMENWVFGCDICQDVCPWNRFAKQHEQPAFDPHPNFLEMSKKDWKEITEEVFNEIFRRSALKRIQYEGLKKNLNFVQKKKG